MNTPLSPDDPTYLFHWIANDLMNAIVGVLNNINVRVHNGAEPLPEDAIDLAGLRVFDAWQKARVRCDIAEALRLAVTLDEVHSLSRAVDDTFWHLTNACFVLCYCHPGTTFPPPDGKDSPPCTPPNPPSSPPSGPSTEASSV